MYLTPSPKGIGEQGGQVECADVNNIGGVIEAIGGQVLHTLVAEVTLFLGIVTGSVKLVMAGGAR